MAAPAPLLLSELTYRIEQTINGVFAGQSYWVVAEVSSHKLQPTKGFHYFELVEKSVTASGLKAKVSAVAWSAGAQQIAAFEKVTGQPFRDGLQVLVKVAVDYNALYGLKLILQDIDAGFTIGQLEQQKQATLQRLLVECAGYIQLVGGVYLTANNQLTLPAVLQRIAVVTAQSSAGHKDFHHTLLNNQFGYRFVIDPYFTAVQGEDNAPLIRQRMLDIFTSGKHYDVVVIIRGGGTNTDFLVFDTFMLGQVTAKFPIPVITGIGHQHNETIVDLMAHTPLKTPTKAAEFIIAHNKYFEDKLNAVQNRLIVKTQQLLAAQTTALMTVERTVIHEAQASLHNRMRQLENLRVALTAQPAFYVSSRRKELAEVQRTLNTVSRRFLQDQEQELDGLHKLVKLMHPDSILKRGFALLQYKGNIVANAAALAPGEELQVVLANATVTTTIKLIEDGPNTHL